MGESIGNYTVVGSSVQAFAAVVAALESRQILWSSACDKKGDWMASAGDEATLALVVRLVGGIPGVEKVVRFGPILGDVEDHPDHADMMAAIPEWQSEGIGK